MTSCLDQINQMTQEVDRANTNLILSMIDANVKYEDVCVRPDLTYGHYFDYLKEKWELIINSYVDQPDKCSGTLQSLLFLHELGNRINQSSESSDQSNPIAQKELEKMMYDRMTEQALNMIGRTGESHFVMDVNMMKTMINLAKTFGENCQCQMIDIFTSIANKYRLKYAKKLEGLSKEDAMKIIKNDYTSLRQSVESFASGASAGSELITGIGSGLGMAMNFSIENELNRLIPDNLGSLKIFFVKVISKYYNELHPIIWIQVFRGIVNNIFKELPISPDEMFGFISKQLLLNSGPFVLKILQMIRPVLSDELAKKYNLTKLTYPMLEKNQVELILKNVLIDYPMTRIIYNKSASVGHVCIGMNTKNPEDMFVVKIIKPLAIAQSCWEYNVLKDLFPQGGCEDQFVRQTLRSNGAEMNVANEIRNLNRSHQMYTSDYATEFKIQIDAKVTTIQHKQGIVREDSWFALAMTLAPGVPLSDLIESKMLEKDTRFRANLHRCLDVLVSRFFYTIISAGFYHGDLHAGNIFYSFKHKQITLIDFGAMGDIDLYDGNSTTEKLLQIIIMSINYNYDEMLDILTDLLNSRCTESTTQIIDKNSPAYQKLKQLLFVNRIKNIMFDEAEQIKNDKYLEQLSGQKRIESETVGSLQTIDQLNQPDDQDNSSIYDYLDRVAESKETVVENIDLIPVRADVEPSKLLSFDKIMEMIIGYYAVSGVNVTIKFAELNELQKAYALLLGVLAKTGYSSYRMGMALRTGIMKWGNLTKAVHVKTTYDIMSTYWAEADKQTKLKERIMSEKAQHTAGQSAIVQSAR